MKHTLKFMLLASLLFAFGCKENKDPKAGLRLGEGPSYVQEEPLGDISSYNPQLKLDYTDILAQEEDIIKNAPTTQINKFAFDMYEQIKGDENITYSPMSISLALSMTYAGANGATKDEMKTALSMGENDPAYHDSVGKFVSLLNHKDHKGTELNISNGTWLAQGFDVLASFQDTLKSAYSIKAVNIDFMKDPERATTIINKTISEQTKSKIDTLLKTPLDKDTKLVLTNAVYFSGKWLNQFNEANTAEDKFVTATEEMNVPFMKQTGKFLYSEDAEKQVVATPYEDGEFAMVFVLPKAEQAAYLTKTSTPEEFATMMDALKEKTVNLMLPKFSQRLSPDVKSVLTKLGMTKAFDEQQADFSGISKEKLFINAIAHEAMVEINETGTTAAAATAVIVVPGSAVPGVDPEQPVDFNATRPFMYYLIHQKTKAILFMGRVDKP